MEDTFLATYPAKLMEYSLAVFYLLLFIPFWKYVQGGKEAPEAEEQAHAPASAAATRRYSLPEGVLLHPGHTWAKAGTDGLVMVGIDEFAARMLGPVKLGLPAQGASVAQGGPIVVARDGGHEVLLVSPVDGTVVEVNPASREGAWQRDPYGAGWLFKVDPERMPANERQLLAGETARRWLKDAVDSLRLRAPDLGAVLASGGPAGDGVRELEPQRWGALCREYFRS